MSKLFTVKSTNLTPKSKARLENADKENNSLRGRAAALSQFNDDFYADLFCSWCTDTQDAATVDKARIFKDEVLKNNQVNANTLDLHSFRIAVSTVVTIANHWSKKKFTTLNLADNIIGDYGMTGLKYILTKTEVQHLNLASNMFSEKGLAVIYQELIKNRYIKTLDLGVWEGSIRKNSFEVEGARFIADILMGNPIIETLKLQDNDFGVEGAKLIAAGLKGNSTLKHLKLAENNIGSEGAEYIFTTGLSLEHLDLSKNFIGSDAGEFIGYFLKENQYIKKLNLEFNQLGSLSVPKFCELLPRSSLRSLNLKANFLGDDGIKLLAVGLEQNTNLEELDLSLNEITSSGINGKFNFKKFINLAKNPIGDEGLKALASNVSEFSDSCTLTKIDVSSCKFADEGLISFLNTIKNYQGLIFFKGCDNYVSDKCEKTLLEILEQNKTYTEFSLNGNRISLGCLSKIRKINARNQKESEAKEPGRLKTELNRLQHEQKKLQEAKEKAMAQEKELKRAEEMKEKIIVDIKSIHDQHAQRRRILKDIIQEQEGVIEKKKEQIDEKKIELEKVSETKEFQQRRQQDISDTAIRTKNELNQEYMQLKAQKEKLENDYQKTINFLKDHIAGLKQKADDMKKKEESLTLEYKTVLQKKKNENKQPKAD